MNHKGIMRVGACVGKTEGEKEGEREREWASRKVHAIEAATAECHTQDRERERARARARDTPKTGSSSKSTCANACSVSRAARRSKRLGACACARLGFMLQGGSGLRVKGLGSGV